jgi:hypothetical protein
MRELILVAVVWQNETTLEARRRFRRTLRNECTAPWQRNVDLAFAEGLYCCVDESCQLLTRRTFDQGGIEVRNLLLFSWCWRGSAATRHFG